MATVLVVDDDDQIRTLVARALAGRHEVIEASDARSALAVLAERTPDLIVCDVMLPKVNGFALVREIRSHDLGKRVPVVFLTAKSSPMDVVEGINAGARAYVTKPFQLGAFVQRIDRILASPR